YFANASPVACNAKPLRMKLRTKKLIAREFLLLTITLAVGLICFIGTYPYNNYIKRQSGNLNEEIADKTKIKDSLSYQHRTKLQKKNWFFEKFTAKFGSDVYKNDELWSRLSYLAEKDSIKHKWNKWDKELIEFNKELEFDTPEKFKEFFDKNKITINDSTNYMKSQILSKDIEELKTKRKEAERKHLSFKQQINFGVTSAIILGILLFAVRYLFYAIKWSIKILKQKSEAAS
ncbi:MAG: hypothetical protein KDB92_13460, partial [Chitinophagaceae bacterium]|nr:hypothetical protein [Chitinophagaceae bacterium]